FDASNGAVWGRGVLYYAYETCAADDCRDGARKFLRLLKVPVHHAHSGNYGVFATSDRQKGYLYPSLGNSAGDPFRYSRAAIEVNTNDDLVMVFSRTGRVDTTQYPSVRYSILYHARNRFSHSTLVANGELHPLKDLMPEMPWGSGVIDLGGAGVDPRGFAQ